MYRKSIRAIRYERKAARCETMRAAKERKRLARAESWTVIREIDIRDPRTNNAHHWTVSASPCGRYVDILADGRHHVCGSERTVRSAIARVLWRVKG